MADQTATAAGPQLLTWGNPMLFEHDVVNRLEGVSVEKLRLWVSQGWVRPPIGAGGQYSEADLARAAFISDLLDDIGLDPEAVPVVLKLVDQIHGLRRELRGLVEAIEKQPQEIRAEVRAHIEARTLIWRSGGDPSQEE
jgi:chaperone modulatory protein CbpM